MNNMKITNIIAVPFRIPLKDPFRMAHFTVRYMHYVLITVETDIGIIGYGEATPAWEVNGETCDSIVGYIELLKNKDMTGYSILGEKLDSLEDVERLIDTVINPVNEFSLIAGNSAAKAALEQAIYYAYCSFKKKSFIELYHLKQTPVPSSTTIGIDTISNSLQLINKAIEASSSIIRLKIGRKDVDGRGFNRDLTVIQETKKIILSKKKKVRLVADANQGFANVKTAVAFCKQIEGCLDWLEQPLAADNLTGFSEIKKESAVPLMADESITSYKDAKVLFELGGIDYLNIKLMKTGGLRGAIKIIDWEAPWGAWHIFHGLK
jgi:L-alanine-DL-glutamate epimerase-like enolase superfamily enzyme